jgi:hypothetical protein
MDTTAHEIAEVFRTAQERAAGSERRQHDRFSYHTVVNVLLADGANFDVQRCWLSDISATGSRIVGRQPLSKGELFLQILMDGLERKFISAEIINERVVKSDRVIERRAARYVYGIRFKAFVSNATVLERLSRALPEAGELL